MAFTKKTVRDIDVEGVRVVEGNIDRVDLLAVGEDLDLDGEVGALGVIGLTGVERDLLEFIGQAQLDLAVVLPVEVGADPHDAGG